MRLRLEFIPAVLCIAFGLACLARGSTSDLIGFGVSATAWLGLVWLSRPVGLDARLKDVEAKLAQLKNRVG